MTSFPGLQDYFEEDDVLFEASPWAILSVDKLAGYMNQSAVIGHKCEEFDVIQFMDEEDSLRGECWWCKQPIPEEIQGLWKMLNWEQLPKMRVYESDEEWEALSPDRRFNKALTQTCINPRAKQSTNGDTVVGASTKQRHKPMTWGPITAAHKHPAGAPKKDVLKTVPKDKKQTVVGRYKAP